jgi:hypothetical protein
MPLQNSQVALQSRRANIQPYNGHISATACSLNSIVERSPCKWDAERMAVHLATECFFGESVMCFSTPTGVGGNLQLDPAKLERINNVIARKRV